MPVPPVRLLYCGDVRTVPRLLRDAGHEVVALEAGLSPRQLSAIAVQEDVALIAVDDCELGAAAAAGLPDVVVFWITSESGPS